MKINFTLLLLLTAIQISFAQEKKVGIGTFIPDAQLHVKGDKNNQKIVKIESSDGTDVLNANNDGSLELPFPPKTSSSNSTYDILTRNKTTNRIEKISSIPLAEADPVWNQARVSTKTYKGNIPSNAELNNYTETGIYNVILDNISVEAQNFPVANIGVLEVFNSDNTTYQIYHTGAPDNSLYSRNKLNYQWSNWRKILNDGDFNPNNYLPLTGGKLSGNLTVDATVTQINSIVDGNLSLGMAGTIAKVSSSGGKPPKPPSISFLVDEKGNLSAKSIIKMGRPSTNILLAGGGDIAQSDLRPYKVYTALLSQTGTSAPTAIVLENTFGGTVVWTRISKGQYIGTLTGAFTLNKTIVFATTGFNDYVSTNAYSVDVNSVSIDTFSTNDLLSEIDDAMYKTSFEIRVYNFIFIMFPYSMLRKRKKKKFQN